MALEQGADEFIAMPIMPTELKSRLRAMLRLKEAISESTELTKENKKLQELDKIKSNFISKASHELKTPLQAILGYTDILKEGLQGELTYPQKLMIKQIREAGEQLLGLISQLLDFETIEKNGAEITPEIFNVESVFSYLTQVLAPIAIKKNIKLKFVSESQNIQIESSKNHLERILLNIVSNSIKFSNENSAVLITAKELTDEVIEFKIQDHGKGIEKSNITYIFDKFWQEDDSITRAHGGLGIGLTVVKKLITILNGQIKVESKPNKGSIFTVLLPKEFKSSKTTLFDGKSLQNAV
jgi:signal transduction histidine kinase